MRGGKSGTSVIQVRVPEFKVVNFRVVKKGPGHRHHGGNDKQEELRKMLEKT